MADVICFASKFGGDDRLLSREELIFAAFSQGSSELRITVVDGKDSARTTIWATTRVATSTIDRGYQAADCELR